MFRFLEHPSEEYVEVQANTMEEVFQEAGIALFEIMTDTSKIGKDLSFPVELEAQQRDFLLIDWLNRLILLHEVENVFLAQFHVKFETAGPWKLSATVHGEKISQEHERRAAAKSATFGQLEWNQTEQGHRVRFVVYI